MADKLKPLELLSKVDIFSSLPKTELKALTTLAKPQLHREGAVVFHQGEASDSFHVVESGKFDVFLWDDMLKIERPITNFGRGDIFGEMGVLTGEPRSAFVRCKERGETFCFEKNSFLKFLEQNPKVLLAISSTLVHRLNASNAARRIPYENLGRFEIEKEAVQTLPLNVILHHRLLPIQWRNGKIIVGLVDPEDLVGRNTAIQFLKGQEIEWVCISQPDFEIFREKQLYSMAKETVVPSADEPPGIVYTSLNPAAEQDATSPVARRLDDLLARAIDSAASDVHLEPGPENIGVRVRVDGNLVSTGETVGFEEYRSLVSRLKVLADLDITERRTPQEAAIRIRYGDRKVDLRLSTLPTPRGESVVLRLIDPRQQRLDLRNLIIHEPTAAMVERLFLQPTGLLLVTGPTGSGKTTTLYAGIQTRLKTFPTEKLVTAEDPVEYEFANTTQVQVNEATGLTFASILRSVLRQDPDVVLVGEMRDKPSMDIALEAALTGHFVLSSLHTNGVFETVMRLRQRGMEPYVIASALKAVISQRLVPRLCSLCRKEQPLSETERKALRQSGILAPQERPKTWQANGCPQCRMSGRQGRVALLEVLSIDAHLREAMEKEATMMEMRKCASHNGYVPMNLYAKELLRQGLVAANDLTEVFPSY